jgi:hypothetical protein
VTLRSNDDLGTQKIRPAPGTPAIKRFGPLSRHSPANERKRKISVNLFAEKVKIRSFGKQVTVSRDVSVKVQMSIVENSPFRVILEIPAQELESHLKEHYIRHGDDNAASLVQQT